MPDTETPTKNCPFCGSNLLSKESRVPAWGSDVPEETIVCNDCAASAPEYVWNQRSNLEVEHCY